MTAPQHLTLEQKGFLDLCTIGTWNMNPETGLIDVKGDFNCSYRGLKSLNGIRLGHVSVVFYCWDNMLTSLEGAPKSVGLSFYCEVNQLVSLVGAPKTVGGNFYCSDNKLTSLKGAPEQIKGEFLCDSFKLVAGEWNPGGWLKAAQKSDEAAKLLVPLISEDELDNWMRKHPLDLDLLDEFPEIKRGVLKRTGLRDISKLAAARRQGLV